MWAFDLNGVMAFIFRYFAKFGSFWGPIRERHGNGNRGDGDNSRTE